MQKLFCLFILLFYFSSYAEEIQQINTDSVIVTDKKENERGHIITNDEMLSNNASSLADVLSLSPGVMIDEGGPRGDVTFKIRGFDASAFPIVILSLA